MVSPCARVQWAGLTWPRDDQGKIQTWSISVTQAPVSNTDSSHPTPCVIFMGLLYLSTQTGGPKITEILSVTGPQAESPESRSWQDHVPCRPPRKDPSSPLPTSHSLACPLASGRIASISVVTRWILPVPLSTSYKEASQLATSPPSLWSLTGVSPLLHPLLARRPVILDDGSP